MTSLRERLGMLRYYGRVRPWRQLRRHQKKQIQARDADAFVISFPKSGRTWHRLMFGYYLTQMLGRPQNESLRIKILTQLAGLPRCMYAHNGANFNDAWPADHPLVADSSWWAGKQVLLLVRDPRDLVVSAYFHARYRDRIWFLSLSEFIRNERTGIAKILNAYSRWFANQHLAKAFAVLAYEEMHSNPAAALRRTLSFFGLERPDENLIASSVAFASFENMRALEDRSYFADVAMRTTGKAVAGRKVRSGRIGAHSEHVSVGDLAFMNAAIREAGGPLAERYGSS